MVRFVKDTDKGFNGIVSNLNEIKDSFVKVGLQGLKGNEKHGESKFKTVVEIGANHEFGKPQERIPERSFLRSTFDSERRNWQRFNRELLQKVLSNIGFSKKVLDVIGLRIQNDIKKFIRKGIPPPNALATIEQKRKKTKGSMIPRKTGIVEVGGKKIIPLIDTGQMINSITYEKHLKGKIIKR